jgi:hypothetical protein
VSGRLPSPRSRIVEDQKRWNAYGIEQGAKEWRESPTGKLYKARNVSNNPAVTQFHRAASDAVLEARVGIEPA